MSSEIDITRMSDRFFTMNRVLLLGAGASKAFESPLGVRMPIAKDFFQTYFKIEPYGRTEVLVGHILHYIQRTRNLDPTLFPTFNEDIEKFYSEIEEVMKKSFMNIDRKIINGNSLENYLFTSAVYTQLSFFFAYVVNLIQNGPLSISHMKLANNLSENDTVITFNWDTILDKCLSKTDHWKTDDGYGIIPHKIYRNKWVLPKNSSSYSSYPKIFKLHGSTNWLTGYPVFQNERLEPMLDCSYDKFWVYESTKSPYPTFDGRFMPGYEDFSYGYYPVSLEDFPKKADEGKCFISSILRYPGSPKGKGPSQGVLSAPLIIPPVLDKQYGLYGILFESLWEQAGKAIEKADEIIIIGYSFPITDVQSQSLFKKSFIKRNSIPKIKILDPNPENIKHIISCSFGIPETYISVFKDYFSDNFELDKLFD